MKQYKFNQKIFQKPFRYYLRRLFTRWYFWAFVGACLAINLVPYLIIGNNDEVWNGSSGIWDKVTAGLGKKITDGVNSGSIIEAIKGCWAAFAYFLPNFTFLLVTLLHFAINGYLVDSKKVDDQNILILATPTRREEVFWGKLVAFGLFLFTANLLAISLPILLLGTMAGVFSLLSGLLFFLLSAIIFPLLIFLAVASIFFYNWAILMVAGGLLFLSRLTLKDNKSFCDMFEKIIEQPFFLLIIAIPIGVFFYYLYWKKFQKKDF